MKSLKRAGYKNVSCWFKTTAHEKKNGEFDIHNICTNDSISEFLQALRMDGELSIHSFPFMNYYYFWS